MSIGFVVYPLDYRILKYKSFFSFSVLKHHIFSHFNISWYFQNVFSSNCDVWLFVRNVANVKPNDAFWLEFLFLIRLRKYPSIPSLPSFFLFLFFKSRRAVELYQMPFCHFLVTCFEIIVIYSKLSMSIYRVWWRPDVLF